MSQLQVGRKNAWLDAAKEDLQVMAKKLAAWLTKFWHKAMGLFKIGPKVLTNLAMLLLGRFLFRGMYAKLGGV